MPRTLNNLLERLEARGEAPFLAAGDALISAAGFAERARRLAGGLRQLGFDNGDRLAILLHRSVEESLAFFAAGLAGGIAVVLNPKLRDAQIRFLLDDCEPSMLVASADRAVALRDPIATLAGPVLLSMGELPVPGASPLSQVDGDPSSTQVPAAGSAAAILYTSGSTGGPKGVVQDHGNLTAGAAIVADYLGLTDSDHVLAVLPLSFDYGLNQVLSAAWAGSRVTVADYLSAGELGHLLVEHQPTGLAGVPTLWHDLARALERGVVRAEDCGSLRYLTNSGGRLPESDIRLLREQLPQVELFSMYGLTEAFRSAYLEPDEIDRHPDSFGRAVAGVELLLVDPDSDTVIDGAGTGELVHAGALVAQGYWRRPEATAARFRSDPRSMPGTVVYSGDLVRRDEDGRLYFVARRDGLLKVAGHRISPDEIGSVARAVAGVSEVAVVGCEAGARGHRLVLFVTSKGETDAELARRVRDHCRATLPAYMVPAEVRVLSALPRTAHGKVDLTALRSRIETPCTDDI